MTGCTCPTYIETIATRIVRITDDSSTMCYLDLTDGYASLFLIYAVLCLSKGEATTNEDVHDAWSAWAVNAHPLGRRHHSLVPYAELSPEIQDLDTKFRDAIRLVAHQLKAEVV